MRAIYSVVIAIGTLGTARAAQHELIIEHAGAGGSQEEAQPYIDKFVGYVEKALGWAPHSATGAFSPDPKDAIQQIEKKKPVFAMLDPDLWLQLRKKDSLEPIVQAEGKRQSSGKMYVLIKKDAPAQKLDELKGKKLASNHLQSAKFLSKVVFDGKIDVDKFFVLQPLTSLPRALKAVDRGEADVALIDQADMDYLKSSNSVYLTSMRVVHETAKVPPTPLVAFQKVATEKDTQTLKKVLIGMCSDEKNGGAQICKDLEIDRFKAPDKAAFDEAVRKYEK
jgi:ABC-type phosphate/phosphonate transport system substrate-binding protein